MDYIFIIGLSSYIIFMCYRMFWTEADIEFYELLMLVVCACIVGGLFDKMYFCEYRLQEEIFYQTSPEENIPTSREEYTKRFFCGIEPLSKVMPHLCHP